MGLFDKMREPVILKEDTSATKQLTELEQLLPDISVDMKPLLEQDIRNLRAGLFGENNILYELKNSHMPMYIIRDLVLKDQDLEAQIDFLVVTPKLCFFIECKNLIGDIEITKDGSFIRTVEWKGHSHKEGIYSPITQNERHLELFRKIRREQKGSLAGFLFDKGFSSWHRSVVVLANPKTVLNDRYAPKEIQNQVIRCDQLVSYIKRENSQCKDPALSDKETQQLAEKILSFHTEKSIDYTEKYRKSSHSVCAIQPNSPPITKSTTDSQHTYNESNTNDASPICPVCGKKLLWRKGKYSYFWGCSGYPACTYTRKPVAKK